MIAGDFAAYFIGLSVEYEWGSQASLFGTRLAAVSVTSVDPLNASWRPTAWLRRQADANRSAGARFSGNTC